MKTKIEKFLEKFPKNATSWADATDEIRDLSRESREYLEECDGVEVEPVDFKACKTPAEWNTRGRESILANFDKMRPMTQKAFYERFREWFEQPEPEESEAMTREELIQSIYDIHAKVKKTAYGEFLISHAQLERHLAKHTEVILHDIKRFYDELIEANE